MVAHRVLLKFKPGPQATDLARVKSNCEATYFEPLGGAGWYRLDSPGKTVTELMATAASDTAVAQVTPDGVGTVARRLPLRPLLTSPDDPDFPQQWALENSGQTINSVTGTPGADIHAVDAWGYSTGSAAIQIADLDSGIDYSHPDLAANMWSAPSAYTITEGGVQYNCPAGSHGFSAVEGNEGCAGQEADDLGHGTATAGIMGAVGNNETNVTGVNWTSSLISLVVVSNDHWTASAVVTAIDAGMQMERAGAHIRLGNMNLSGGDGNPAVADEMRLSGWLYAAATGNDCLSGAEYPAEFKLFNEIAVSASDQLDERAVWNGGQCSDGGGDIAAPGKNNWSTANGGGETLFAGTSSATPHVTGGAALLMSYCPLTPHAVAQTLEGTADQISALSSIATDGRRLDLGSALASCATGTPGTGEADLTVYTDPSDPDTGSVWVTFDGIKTSVNYNSARDTTDSIGQELADHITVLGYVTATCEGNGVISLTSDAVGPFTGYEVDSGVVDDCGPGDDCGRPPDLGITLNAGGN
ncbi:MAG: S8 family serine peptidase [Terriglobales bacterium]